MATKTQEKTDKLVEVRIKYAYGYRRIYPANILAQNLATFANLKCFSEIHLKTLQELGYQIELIPEELKL